MDQVGKGFLSHWPDDLDYYCCYYESDFDSDYSDYSAADIGINDMSGRPANEWKEIDDWIVGEVRSDSYETASEETVKKNVCNFQFTGASVTLNYYSHHSTERWMF